VTFAVGVLGSTGVIYARFHAGFNQLSTLRILGAAAVVFLADLVLSPVSLPVIISLLLSAAIYIAALRVMGELRGLRAIMTLS